MHPATTSLSPNTNASMKGHHHYDGFHHNCVSIDQVVTTDYKCHCHSTVVEDDPSCGAALSPMLEQNLATNAAATQGKVEKHAIHHLGADNHDNHPHRHATPLPLPFTAQAGGLSPLSRPRPPFAALRTVADSTSNAFSCHFYDVDDDAAGAENGQEAVVNIGKKRKLHERLHHCDMVDGFGCQPPAPSGPQWRGQDFHAIPALERGESHKGFTASTAGKFPVAAATSAARSFNACHRPSTVTEQEEDRLAKTCSLRRVNSTINNLDNLCHQSGVAGDAPLYLKTPHLGDDKSTSQLLQHGRLGDAPVKPPRTSGGGMLGWVRSRDDYEEEHDHDRENAIIDGLLGHDASSCGYHAADYDDDEVVITDLRQFSTMFTNGHGAPWVVHEAATTVRPILNDHGRHHQDQGLDTDHGCYVPRDMLVELDAVAAEEEAGLGLLYDRHEVIQRCQSCPTFRSGRDGETASTFHPHEPTRVGRFTGFTNGRGDMLFHKRPRREEEVEHTNSNQPQGIATHHHPAAFRGPRPTL